VKGSSNIILPELYKQGSEQKGITGLVKGFGRLETRAKKRFFATLLVYTFYVIYGCIHHLTPPVKRLCLNDPETQPPPEFRKAGRTGTSMPIL